jgi:hypothetical protein
MVELGKTLVQYFHFSIANLLSIGIFFNGGRAYSPNCNDLTGSLLARQKWALGTRCSGILLFSFNTEMIKNASFLALGARESCFLDHYSLASSCLVKFVLEAKRNSAKFIGYINKPFYYLFANLLCKNAQSMWCKQFKFIFYL